MCTPVGGKGKLEAQVVSLRLASYQLPQRGFVGRHDVTAVGEYYLGNNRLWSLPGEYCGGNLISFSSPHLTGIQCDICGAMLLDTNRAQETSREWAKILYGALQDELRYKVRASHPEFGRELGRVGICFPAYDWVDEKLWSCLVQHCPSLEAKTDPQNRSAILPVWLDQELMVCQVEYDEGPLALAQLFDLSNLLMMELEGALQSGIDRAAKIAKSASERFHPRTRRPRG